MQEKDALLDVDTGSNWVEKNLGLSVKSLVIITLVVSVIGIYIGNLLFGDNSLESLIQLQDYEESLIEEVSRLKSENALMQKEYFELKEITKEQ